MVSDNGPPFASAEIRQFCKQNGITLTHSPPYHPKSNGSAEKAVQNIKNFLRKYLIERKSISCLERTLSEFLFNILYTSCPKTGLAPAEIVLKRLARTKLTMLKPDFNNSNIKGKSCRKISVFQPEQSVFVKAYGEKSVRWWQGQIIERKNAVTNLVLVNGRERLYHAGNIKIDET